MPRFVILHHETPPGYDRPPHWDLMLKSDRALRTWALAEPPCAGRLIAAEELADHRLAYLDYQGDVSGGRGSVVRWDGGTYELLSGDLQRETFGQTALRLTMHGQRLIGEVTLTPAQTPHEGADAPRSPEGAARYWSFIWEGT